MKWWEVAEIQDNYTNCVIFHNQKKHKKVEVNKKGQEPGLEGMGSWMIGSSVPPPPPPPHHTHTYTPTLAGKQECRNNWI